MIEKGRIAAISTRGISTWTATRYREHRNQVDQHASQKNQQTTSINSTRTPSPIRSQSSAMARWSAFSKLRSTNGNNSASRRKKKKGGKTVFRGQLKGDGVTVCFHQDYDPLCFIKLKGSSKCSTRTDVWPDQESCGEMMIKIAKKFCAGELSVDELKAYKNAQLKILNIPTGAKSARNAKVANPKEEQAMVAKPKYEQAKTRGRPKGKAKASTKAKAKANAKVAKVVESDSDVMGSDDEGEEEELADDAHDGETQASSGGEETASLAAPVYRPPLRRLSAQTFGSRTDDQLETATSESLDKPATEGVGDVDKKDANDKNEVSGDPVGDEVPGDVIDQVGDDSDTDDIPSPTLSSRVACTVIYRKS